MTITRESRDERARFDIVARMAANSGYGLTWEEYALSAAETIKHAWERFDELREAGLIVPTGAIRRVNDRSRWLVVYVPTAAGLAWVREGKSNVEVQ